MGEEIREIKSQIRSAENARLELMRRIDRLQRELSAQYMDKLRQHPSYTDGSRVDEAMLEASKHLDKLAIEYMNLEKRLGLLQETMIEVMDAEKEE